MLKIKFTKDSMKNHFRYFVWVYVIVAFVTGAIFNTIVTMVKNQSPPDRKLSTYICGDFIGSSYFYAFLEEMERDFSELDVVDCENLAYNSGTMLASGQKQKFLANISSKYGDVMIIPYNEFADLVKYNYFAVLDDDFAEYIDDLDPISLKTVTMNLDGKGSHVYAIPLSHLEFFPYSYDTSDKVVVWMDYSQNPEYAKKMVKWLLDFMIETDWYAEKA